MIESFIGEAIDKIENPELHTALMAYAMNWLAHTARG
jgi:Fe-S cluster assembly protein SufD